MTGDFVLRVNAAVVPRSSEGRAALVDGALVRVDQSLFLEVNRCDFLRTERRALIQSRDLVIIVERGDKLCSIARYEDRGPTIVALEVDSFSQKDKVVVLRVVDADLRLGPLEIVPSDDVSGERHTAKRATPCACVPTGDEAPRPRVFLDTRIGDLGSAAVKHDALAAVSGDRRARHDKARCVVVVLHDDAVTSVCFDVTPESKHFQMGS